MFFHVTNVYDMGVITSSDALNRLSALCYRVANTFHFRLIHIHSNAGITHTLCCYLVSVLNKYEVLKYTFLLIASNIYFLEFSRKHR